MLGPSSTPTQVNQQILREMLKREVPFPFPQPLIVNMNLLLLVKVYFNQLWALRKRENMWQHGTKNVKIKLEPHLKTSKSSQGNTTSSALR